MEGHRWRLSCLLGRFTGWLLLGILSCGIGFIWIGPYLMVSMAKFYEDLPGRHIRAVDPTLGIEPGP
jgi:uncharacterized membrane protein